MLNRTEFGADHEADEGMIMDLPNRDEITNELERMIKVWKTSVSPPGSVAVAGRDRFQPEPTPPAVYAIGLNDIAELVQLDQIGTDQALIEIVRRLSRLVRSDDVLGQVDPGLFLLAASAVAPSTARQIMDRVTGAVAMPLEIGGNAFCVSISIGIAFAFDEAGSEELVAAALTDLERIQDN